MSAVAFNAMSGRDAGGGDPSAAAPVFRRATEADAVALAREMFLADQRVDLNTLAGRLGVSRATMHRWVHTREALLDRLLGQLAAEYFEDALVHARANPDDAVAALAHALSSATAGSPPLRGFVTREPELALRLMLGESGAVRQCIREGIQTLVESIYPDEAGRLEGFADAVTEVGAAVQWATLAGGGEPSADRVAQLARALLAGARAGELRAAS